MAKQTSNFRQETRAQQGKKANFTIFPILRFPKVIAAIKAAYVPTLMAPLKKQILAFFGILEWLGKLTIDGATCYIGKFCTFFNFKVSQSYCGNQSSLCTYFDGPT